MTKTWRNDELFITFYPHKYIKYKTEHKTKNFLTFTL